MSANNQLVIIGRVGNVPAEDSRNTPSGSRVVEVRLAVNRPGKDPSGNSVTDWISCQFWNKQGENLAEFAKKGDLISVSGSIRVDNWEQEGQKRQKYFVHGENFQMLESRAAREQRAPEQGSYAAQEREAIKQEYYPSVTSGEPAKGNDFALDDDELPPF